MIAFDLPLWRKIVEEADCGVVVDPLHPKDLAIAIDAMHDDQQRAAEMGRNVSQAVLTKFNWEIEETKLIKFYGDLADPRD